MEFLARPIGDKYECRLLSDEKKIIFHLRVPENTLACWILGLEEWLKRKSNKFAQVNSYLLQLVQCQFPEESKKTSEQEEPAQLTFLKVTCALLGAMENSCPNRDMQDSCETIRHFLDTNRILNLVPSSKGDTHSYGFWVLDKPLPRLQFRTNEDHKIANLEQWSVWLAHDKVSKPTILEILRNHDLLDEIVHRRTWIQSDITLGFFLQSYANFIKALVKFLDETQDRLFIPFRRRIAHLCASVVKNEDMDLEEQKLYLERIFTNHDLNPTAKYHLLKSVFNDLKKDAKKDSRHLPRLTAMVSAITQYYLKQYDLERAIEFWRHMDCKRDYILHGILALYQSPQRFVFVLSVWIISTLLPNLEWATYLVAWSASILLSVTLIVFVFGIYTILVRFLRRHGVDYIELFLPRLLGAVVVGLSILVFENTVWDISLKIDWLNWSLICLATYTASLAYIFTDVHKTTRLLPSVAEPVSPKERATVVHNPTSRSLETTWKVFCIGLFESLIASLLVSSILGSAVLPDQITGWLANGKEFLRWDPIVQAMTLVGSDQSLLGFAWRFWGTSTFVYFPRIVLLWTGLALLIGSFAQLLWQDKQITSS